MAARLNTRTWDSGVMDSSYPPGSYLPSPSQPSPPGPLTHLADGTPLASVWKRLAAQLLDWVFISLLMLPFAAICLVVMMNVFTPHLSTVAADPESPEAVTSLMTAWFRTAILVSIGFLAVSIVVAYFYYIVRVRQVGATFGKQILGLRIRSIGADGQLTHGQLWARWGIVWVVNYVSSGLAGLLDVMWCLWDPNRQCLHDKLAGTVVIDNELPVLPPGHPQVQLARASAMPRGWVANGPVPHTPPGYPRHPGAGRYLGL